MFRILAAALFLFTLAGQAAAEEPPRSISSPEEWSTEVMASIKAADYDGLELLLLGAIDHKEPEIRDMLGQFRAWVGPLGVVYSDLLFKRDLGTSMEQRIYSVYYGSRRFMYVSMVFARGEGNWLVMAFNFDTEIDRLMDRLS